MITTKSKLCDTVHEANRTATEKHMANLKNVTITPVEGGYLVTWREAATKADPAAGK